MKNTDDKNRIIIFDTTLRDGEQSPGASLSVKDKIQIANQLERLGVDIIEAGFPISSAVQFEAVQACAAEVKNSVVCGLARALEKDITNAHAALKDAAHPRIHTFIATSPIHMEYKLYKTGDEVLKMAIEAVKLAKSFLEDVEFSAEDAFRSDRGFLKEVVSAVIEAGATTVNIPDTVGYAIPNEFGDFISDIVKSVQNLGDTVISVHCHNDLGLAVANSLMAVRNGARQIEVAVNGLGERAGNASLEEIVMAFKVRKDFLGFDTGINTREIFRTSQLVSNLTGIRVQPNKAIVGANAFAHESGIHVDGLLKKRSTYEIMTPDSIGLTDMKIVLGRHSGRHGLQKRLEDMGYKLTPSELDATFDRFLKVADKKKEVFDEDIAAIVEDEIHHVPEFYKLEYFHISSGSSTIPTSTVRMSVGNEVKQQSAYGDGPVDATYKAINAIAGITLKLGEYSLRAVTEGTEAIGEVTLKMLVNDHFSITGRGASTDILEASAKAYVDGLNKIRHRIMNQSMEPIQQMENNNGNDNNRKNTGCSLGT
ncbi:MAG TPA: 2-isopropylmalate synthase [Anaerolineae bacterium]|nr:2-isopropylmalate synthase [Anaerolineae bacterium]